MKCKFCGGEHFFAHQQAYLDVIVDGENFFIENDPAGEVQGKTPYGPYTCVRCGAEYDELKEGTPETSGPIDNWEERLDEFRVIQERQENKTIEGKIIPVKTIAFKSRHFSGDMEVVPKDDGSLHLMRWNISNTDADVFELDLANPTLDENMEPTSIYKLVFIPVRARLGDDDILKFQNRLNQTVRERENFIKFMQDLNVVARRHWGLIK